MEQSRIRNLNILKEKKWMLSFVEKLMERNNWYIAYDKPFAFVPISRREYPVHKSRFIDSWGNFYHVEDSNLFKNNKLFATLSYTNLPDPKYHFAMDIINEEINVTCPMFSGTTVLKIDKSGNKRGQINTVEVSAIVAHGKLTCMLTYRNGSLLSFTGHPPSKMKIPGTWSQGLIGIEESTGNVFVWNMRLVWNGALQIHGQETVVSTLNSKGEVVSSWSIEEVIYAWASSESAVYCVFMMEEKFGLAVHIYGETYILPHKIPWSNSTHLITQFVVRDGKLIILATDLEKRSVEILECILQC